MGPLGVQEMLGIFIIALLLFGPKKLPELGRMLGKAVSEFRRAKNDLKSPTFESHLSELEREVEAEKYSGSNTDYSSVHYPYQNDEQGQESSYNSSSVSGTNEPDESSMSQIYRRRRRSTGREERSGCFLA